MKIKILLLALLLSGLQIVKAQTVFNIISDSPDHNTLEAAIGAAGLGNVLNGPGPFTVFAPTDGAFAALPSGTIDALLADPQGALTNILLYHVVGSKALSSDLSDGQVVVTLNKGKTVTITIDNQGVFINDVQVTVANVEADNGVVHVIDGILLPPTTVGDVIMDSPDHNTLEAAIGAAGLGNVLNGHGPFTVFAPTDAAFAALPAGTVDALLQDPQGLLSRILKYHVAFETLLSSDLNPGQIIFTSLPFLETITVTINSDGVFINDAKVIVADIETDNGVVHVIDAVLIPSEQTVMDYIANSPDHAILTSAINAAGLGLTLEGDGPFTVFAPTDAAFIDLPEGTIDALLNDIPTLTSILTYHVVGSNALSSDLADGQVITTLNGTDITVNINSDGVFINDSKVTIADIVATNGVVHVIDAVLLPPSQTNTIFDIIKNSADHNTLEAAILAAELDVVLSGDDTYTVFAPTDAAFAALPTGTIDALLADPQGVLTDILLYHTFDEELVSSDIIEFAPEFPYYVTSNGKTVTFNVTNDGVFINNAKVTVVDIFADNGVVHVIDAVLLPPDSTIIGVVRNSPAHTILESLLDISEFSLPLEGYGPFTLFAPTDAAIGALSQDIVDELLENSGLLEDVLAYHIVGGKALSTDLSNGQIIKTLLDKGIKVTINNDGIFINKAKVTFADIQTDNGVVHVIDAVLLPTTTIVDIVNNSPDHFILSQVLQLTELDDALNQEGPFTLFAPTDDAFDAIPDDVLQAILADPSALSSILTYHAISGKALSTDLSDGQEINTINGAKVKVTINNTGVFINNAQVTSADLEGDNGVVHIIDAVLLPPPSSTSDMNDGDNIVMTPNPVKDIITLEFGSRSQAFSVIDIYNIKGQIINKFQVVSGSQIDVSSLKNGLYFIRIENGDKINVKKFVKI